MHRKSFLRKRRARDPLAVDRIFDRTVNSIFAIDAPKVLYHYTTWAVGRLYQRRRSSKNRARLLILCKWLFLLHLLGVTINRVDCSIDFRSLSKRVCWNLSRF